MRLRFDVKLTTPNGDPFQRLGRKLKRFERDSEMAARKAAEAAEEETRRVYLSQQGRREFTAPRRGRPTTGGRLHAYLNWVSVGTSVLFDLGVEDIAPYWIIQELGTGRSGSAVMVDNRGREKRIPFTIPAQKGRVIPPGLAWGKGGKYHPASGSRRSDQIHPTAKLSLGKTSRGRSKGRVNSLTTPRVTIRREIKGKHFVKAGSQAGVVVYRNQLKKAAEATFRGRRRK